MVSIWWLLSWCGHGSAAARATGGKTVTPLLWIGAVDVQELSLSEAG
jgi:hypothetical protein